MSFLRQEYGKIKILNAVYKEIFTETIGAVSITHRMPFSSILVSISECTASQDVKKEQ